VVRDHREIIEDPGIAAVVISAPRPAMAPLTLEALRAGKHVMMEKPMAHTAAQARCLADAARAAKVTLAVGFMKRYDGGVQAARATFADLLATRRLGRPLLARFYNFARVYAVPPPPHQRPAESRAERLATWPLWPDWLPADRREAYAWFLNSASHDLNLVHFFFPAGVNVVAGMSNADDAVLGVLASGGLPIALEVARSAPGVWLEGIEFLFEKGCLSVRIPSPMATGEHAQVTLREAADTAREIVVAGAPGWCFARQASGFVDALTGAARPLTTGEDGVRDLELCENLWRDIITEAPRE
jgi:predicted dehydrogenase